MNEKNSGKRVRLLQKRLVIAGIIVALVLALVAVIAIPYFLDKRKSIPSGVRMIPARLVSYHVDPNLYPAARTEEEAAKSESIDIKRFLGMRPKKEYKWKKSW